MIHATGRDAPRQLPCGGRDRPTVRTGLPGEPEAVPGILPNLSDDQVWVSAKPQDAGGAGGHSVRQDALLVDQEYPAVAECVRDARGLIQEALAGLPGFDVDIAVLLTSELVTNVIQHTDSAQVLVRAEMESGRVRVTVRDQGSGPPRASMHPKEPSRDRLDGRGLYLVSELAYRWGAEQGPGPGVAVWFELARDDGGSDV